MRLNMQKMETKLNTVSRLARLQDEVLRRNVVLPQDYLARKSEDRPVTPQNTGQPEKKKS